MHRIPLIIVALAALALAACGAGVGGANEAALGTPAPVPAEFAGKTNPLGPDAVAAGAELYQTNCTVCHGPQGHGDGAAASSLHPAPRNLPQLAGIVGDDYLFWRISTGKEGTAMVAWKGVLTEEQIWHVVSYIRTLP